MSNLSCKCNWIQHFNVYRSVAAFCQEMERRNDEEGTHLGFSLGMNLCLSLSFTLCLCLCLSVSLSLYVYIYVCPSVCLSVCLCLSLSLSRFVCCCLMAVKTDEALSVLKPYICVPRFPSRASSSSEAQREYVKTRRQSRYILPIYVECRCYTSKPLTDRHGWNKDTFQ